MLFLRSIKGFVEKSYKSKNKVLALVLTAAYVIVGLTTYFLLSNNDIVIFLIFLSLVPIFAIWKLDGRIPIGYAILLLLLSAGLRNFGYPLALFSYWLLLVGTSCLLIELLKKN